MPSDLSDVFGLLGTDIENKYRVSDVVGEGGFGVVYKGWHKSFERPQQPQHQKRAPDLVFDPKKHRNGSVSLATESRP